MYPSPDYLINPYIDYAPKFRLWFMIGFYIYVISEVVLLMKTLSMVCGCDCNFLVNIMTYFMSMTFLAWGILGSIWRFSEWGKLATNNCAGTCGMPDADSSD